MVAGRAGDLDAPEAAPSLRAAVIVAVGDDRVQSVGDRLDAVDRGSRRGAVAPGGGHAEVGRAGLGRRLCARLQGHAGDDEEQEEHIEAGDHEEAGEARAHLGVVGAALADEASELARLGAEEAGAEEE